MQKAKSLNHFAVRVVRGVQFLGEVFKAGTILCLDVNDAAIAQTTGRGEVIEDYDLGKNPKPGVLKEAPKSEK